VAINGFGRIGRSIFRIVADRADFEVVAINDITPDEPLAYLLRYDTVMGRFKGEVKLEGGYLVAGRQRSRITKGKVPSGLPWRDLEVDVVIESTGRFRTKEECQGHIDAGAKRVILTVPAQNEVDATVVMGVNEDKLQPEHRIISNASCTTNCLAPLAKVLDDRFGIVKGLMTTVHAYTNDQRLYDWAHKDLRRSRAAAENSIPTTTGAARAVGKVLPKLKGKLDGTAVRVPVPDGSIVDLVVELGADVTVASVNEAVREAAAGPMRGIIEFSTEALVSSDIIGNPTSCIFDAPLTQVVGSRTAKVMAWYDNEWGYSNRVVDLAEKLAALG
jgi:glyceraldehyde 3-phosphate dehydrogenase